MKNLLLIIATVLMSGSIAWGQSVPFDKDAIGDKDAYKRAKNAIKDGDDFYETGNEYMYKRAIPHYLIAQEINPDNAPLNLKLGICYLHSPEKLKARQYLKKAYELDPEIDPINLHYLLGRSNHLHGDWEKAQEHYRTQKQKLTGREEYTPEAAATLDRYIEQCENGKDLSGDPVRVWIDNLGPAINSKYPEYSPLISTDESLLILTARRPSGTGDHRDEFDNLPFEDIWYSENEAGNWSELKNMGENINTKGHDATSGLSPDGKTLFVFEGTTRGGGDILVSRFKEGEWTKPDDLSKEVNSNYHESAAALSYDGRTLYFISDREGGQGGRDICTATWDPRKEEYNQVTNLGSVVNSPYDENGIYIHPDGRTIYFSSKGHNTMGGSDIFYSELKNGNWQKPVNIGYPVNSPDDDVFFIVAADGRTAYYSSIREGGYGEKDIYRITFLGPKKQPLLSTEDKLLASTEGAVMATSAEPKVEVRTSNMTLLKGRILDEKTGQPVNATIELVDNETGGILAQFQNDNPKGKYLVTLPAGRNYGISVSAEDYLFHSENFNIPDTAVYKQYNRDIRLKKIEIGSVVVLRNIFFDYDKSTIREESMPELERLTGILKDNPTISIEISGHTDNVGSDQYNQELSEARAKSVVDYLIDQGIVRGRLDYKGYGESEPIATNETPEGRQENRRTEFKIIDDK